MKLILCLFLFALVISKSFAAVSIGIYNDPKHPGKCVYEGKILSPGDHVETPGICQKVECGNDSFVSFYTCGVQGPAEGFKLGEPLHPKAPYPECCERHMVPK